MILTNLKHMYLLWTNHDNAFLIFFNNYKEDNIYEEPYGVKFPSKCININRDKKKRKKSIKLPMSRKN